MAKGIVKKKKLTQNEKKFNAMWKKEMQKKGVLPPDKKKLNRKKFAQEVITEWEEITDKEDMTFYLYRAVFSSVGKNMMNVTSEDVGVLKVIKLAIETKKFMEANRKDGRTSYTVGEYLEKVYEPIRKL